MNFIDFARINGLCIDYLAPSDKIRRCGTIKHPKSKDGAYKFDGFNGWVMDWSNGGELHFYNNPHSKQITEQQKTDWIKSKKENEIKQQKMWDEAAQVSQEALNFAQSKTHYYLNSKGFPDVLGMVVENTLLVPMRNLNTNQLQGVQSINWDGENRCYVKKMCYGMRAKGAVLRLGNKTAKETFLCEGYATGLSIELALRKLNLNACVLICFSDSNLVYISSLLTKGKNYVFADNDKSMAGEIAAKKTGFPWIMSENIGEDANDVYQNKGIMELCKLLMRLRK